MNVELQKHKRKIISRIFWDKMGYYDIDNFLRRFNYLKESFFDGKFFRLNNPIMLDRGYGSSVPSSTIEICYYKNKICSLKFIYDHVQEDNINHMMINLAEKDW